MDPPAYAAFAAAAVPVRAAPARTPERSGRVRLPPTSTSAPPPPPSPLWDAPPTPPRTPSSASSSSRTAGIGTGIGTPRLAASDTARARLKARWAAWEKAQATMASELAEAAEALATTLRGLEAIAAGTTCMDSTTVPMLLEDQRRGLASVVAVQQRLAAIAPTTAPAATATATATAAAAVSPVRVLGPADPVRGLAELRAPARASVVLATTLPVENPDLVPVARLAADVAADVAWTLTVAPQRDAEYAALCRLVLDHLCELADGPSTRAAGPARVGFGAASGLASAWNGGRDPTRTSPDDAPALRLLKHAFADHMARLAAERPSLVERDVVSRRTREVWPHGLGRPRSSNSA